MKVTVIKTYDDDEPKYPNLMEDHYGKVLMFVAPGKAVCLKQAPGGITQVGDFFEKYHEDAFKPIKATVSLQF